MNRLKKLKDKKGFTLMETLIAGALGILVVMGAIFLPATIFKAARNYGETINQRQDIQVILTTMKKDLMETGGVIITDNTISVGDRDYVFKEDGVYRDELQISGSQFLIMERDGFFSLIAENDMELHFNFDGSSFSGGDTNG